MSLFHQFIIVDWSAANKPTIGKNSIWLSIAEGDFITETRNIPTRIETMAFLRQILIKNIESNKRTFVGFDFAFGYPKGTAEHLTGKADWKSLWRLIHHMIEDNENNQSNRFIVANELNKKLSNHIGPFWGHPNRQTFSDLFPHKPNDVYNIIHERRLIEQQIPKAKSVWQLAYTGSVGSQSLLGIHHLQALRCDKTLESHIAIWPFETNFDQDVDKNIVIGEIYPSLFPITQEGEYLDEKQVKTLALKFSKLDKQSKFKKYLVAPHCITDHLQESLQEEGSIIGAS